MIRTMTPDEDNPENGGNENANDDNSVDDSDERPACRICYGHDDPQDPLIAPCACRGTLEFVHASCLRGWLKTTAANGASCHTCSLCGSEHNIRRGSCVVSLRNALAAARIIAGVALDLSLGVWVRGLSPALVATFATVLGGNDTYATVVLGVCRILQVLGFFFFVQMIWWNASSVWETLERKDTLIYDRRRGEYC